MLELDDVSFSYRNKPLIDKVSLSIEAGEIAALIGLSGSGKTTVFRLITGLEHPSSGTVKMRGEVTYMQQSDLLLPWRSVLDNVLLVTELGKLRPGQKKRALGLLHQVGLEGCENLFPKELSGGMRQRVSLARALMQKRPLLLLDEPFGSLDVLIREELYTLLRNLRKSQNMTLLLVTHDFHDAISLSDKIFILSGGRITQTFALSKAIKEDTLQLDEIKKQIKSSLATSSLHSLVS